MHNRSHLTIMAMMVAAMAASAPRPGHTQSTSDGPVIGGTPPAASQQTCVQVEIAGQKGPAYNCLNQELESQAQSAGGGAPAIPLGANSPSNAVGTFNRAGVAEQYGQNFGKSAVPYRPPAPVFNNPTH